MRRVLLPLTLTALAITACAPEKEGKDKEHAPLPFGYELASAKAASDFTESAVIDLAAEELAAMQANGTVRLIDIRTAEEVAEGSIAGAEHIAMDEFDPAVLDQADDREVVLYCRSGRRSRLLGEKLAAQTGKPIKHLSGGIVAWRAADRD
ncbi:rhodanese-like domain-containing protein [uncultured Erythrobacter sp.]|uniref:rhodanese-like domain-containing protein n=1 Tax=uncultured Erythrobacter sp. TaxID=263913 RepID=UPI00261943E3|nr:rhodanese-like domain-containing protein [uncultured Erythrobacter sp.]